MCKEHKKRIASAEDTASRISTPKHEAAQLFAVQSKGLK